mmetsp:Transcript_26773/g.44027  ORF Transcript_26773/g.44027 Transcript_26773/m.44027 type:complete len:226 (+) Transcript_26773:1754-2431(+)
MIIICISATRPCLSALLPTAHSRLLVLARIYGSIASGRALWQRRAPANACETVEVKDLLQLCSACPGLLFRAAALDADHVLTTTRVRRHAVKLGEVAKVSLEVLAESLRSVGQAACLQVNRQQLAVSRIEAAALRLVQALQALHLALVACWLPGAVSAFGWTHLISAVPLVMKRRGRGHSEDLQLLCLELLPKPRVRQHHRSFFLQQGECFIECHVATAHQICND